MVGEGGFEYGTGLSSEHGRRCSLRKQIEIWRALESPFSQTKHQTLNIRNDKHSKSFLREAESRITHLALLRGLSVAGSGIGIPVIYNQYSRALLPCPTAN